MKLGIFYYTKGSDFLEKIEYSDIDLKKEEEADNFAIKWTLTKKRNRKFLDSAPLTESNVNYPPTAEPMGWAL